MWSCLTRYRADGAIPQMCQPETSCFDAAGTVLFYLIRMEPFTAMNRSLQGGRFDHADRLFSNVAATWDNCLHSSSDVKELTPEFYHQPELLLNSNNFNLGTLQVPKLVRCCEIGSGPHIFSM